MTDTDAAAPRAERTDWMAEHLAIYLDSGGAQGHIVDVSSVGGRALTTHCLIRYRGRRTGRDYVKPLIYGNVGGEIAVVASKGGADSHPEWYLNIVAGDTVDVQIATQAFQATWREPGGTERHNVWEFMSHLYPPYIAYQRSTSRHIPILMFSTVRPIDVFTP